MNVANHIDKGVQNSMRNRSNTFSYVVLMSCLLSAGSLALANIPPVCGPCEELDPLLLWCKYIGNCVDEEDCTNNQHCENCYCACDYACCECIDESSIPPEQWAGEHDCSVHWVLIPPGDNYDSDTCLIFGEYNLGPAQCSIDFKYVCCTWVCELTNVHVEDNVLVRGPNKIPGKTSVASASEVPCSQALQAYLDLDDPDLTDDRGAPWSQFWCHAAAVVHEEKHRSDWRLFYTYELIWAIVLAENMSVTVDCDNPATTSAAGAEGLKSAQIGQLFTDALSKASNRFDDPDTPINEAEMRAIAAENAISQPIAHAVLTECTP